MIKLGRVSKETKGTPQVPGFIESLLDPRPGYQVPKP